MLLWLGLTPWHIFNTERSVGGTLFTHGMLWFVTNDALKRPSSLIHTKCESWGSALLHLAIARTVLARGLTNAFRGHRLAMHVMRVCIDGFFSALVELEHKKCFRQSCSCSKMLSSPAALDGSSCNWRRFVLLANSHHDVSRGYGNDKFCLRASDQGFRGTRMQSDDAIQRPCVREFFLWCGSSGL
jgi:hypothetical protein